MATPVYHPYPACYGAYGTSYYHTSTGAYGVSQTAYGAYGSATRTASYNPYTGTSTRTASTSTAYGKQTVGQAYNPYTRIVWRDSPGIEPDCAVGQFLRLARKQICLRAALLHGKWNCRFG